MKLKILVDNCVDQPDVKGELGFSIYIENQGFKVLFDLFESNDIDSFLELKKNSKEKIINIIDSSTKISLISPNNTTDGRLKKTWIIENSKRYLLKGGYKNEVIDCRLAQYN